MDTGFQPSTVGFGRKNTLSKTIWLESLEKPIVLEDLEGNLAWEMETTHFFSVDLVDVSVRSVSVSQNL